MSSLFLRLVTATLAWLVSFSQLAAADENAGGQLLVDAASVQTVLAGSRDETGYIRRIRPLFGLFLFGFEAGRASSDTFSSLLISEIQLIGKTAPFAYVQGYRYPWTDASELVILRDIEEDKIGRLETHIPNARNSIERYRSRLTPASCSFFYEANPDRPERIQTAYVFVGRDVKDGDIGDCLHRQLLRVFGIVERPIAGLSFSDKFLSELLALRIVDICASRERDKQDACYADQLSKLK